MEYLFLSAPVPETQEFMLAGVGGAGNLAVRGIAEGLHEINPMTEVVGFWGIRSFPHVKKIFIRKRLIEFSSGLKVLLLPDINIPVFRNITRWVTSFVSVLNWGWRKRGGNKVIITYNYSVPPISAVILAASIIRAKVVPIVFDIGMPLTRSPLLKDIVIRVNERISEAWLRMVHGACVIVSAIQAKFFSQKCALLVDGGVSPEVMSRLFNLKRTDNKDARKEVVFVLAGSLSEYNGVNLVLKAMKLAKNPSIRLKIAGGGSGQMIRLVAEAAREDKRISYHGRLSLDSLFELYQEMDVFLNLRLTKSIDTSYFFPSKFLEALVVGRYVLTTRVAHLERVYGGLCGIVADESPEACAKAIEECASLTRQYRDSIGISAREWMLENHTWSRQMKRVCKYCEHIVGGVYKNKNGMVDVEV